MDGHNTSSRCLLVGALTWEPYTRLVPSGSSFKVIGVMVKVMDIIANHLGVCYKTVIPEIQDWGRDLGNGSTTGLLALLQNKEIDMSLSPMAFSHWRWQRAVFSMPIRTDEYRGLYKMPTPEANVEGFIKIYTPLVWLMILLITAAVFSVMFFTLKFHAAATRHDYPSSDLSGNWGDVKGKEEGPTVDKQQNSSTVPDTIKASNTNITNLGRVTNLHHLSKSFDWTICCILNQSVWWTPREGRVRLLGGLWLMVSLVMGTVYRSNLKAMLILPKVKIPFNSIEQLAETNIPIYLVQGTVLTHMVQKAAPDSILGRLRPKVEEQEDTSFVIRSAMEGKRASITMKSGLEAILANNFNRYGYCKMYMTKEGYGYTIVGLAFPKNSTLLPKIDKILLRLNDFGIMQHLHRNGVINASECLKPPSTNAVSLRPLEPKDFYGVFSLYIGGVFVAMMVLFVELAVVSTGNI
ncbi:hypothetical protein Pcinc_016861 [Petrolisthes cinctipes]|uniref:Ionotropic glutamate receptor C-terminal domain-containing protein n=1 Tax=Petrolisthes cinctipes TaxID=88211 RepID=A0AAE1FQ86_PETCI|nr:hypothetical protein Pcinc_016861 [Petrolisthes cinctipes]